MPPSSILSHEERTVAEALAAGDDHETIAAAHDLDPATVARTETRIRQKTERALATLAESPFTGAVAAEADPDLLAAVLTALEGRK
jgi:hypothetical protein